MVPYAVDLQGDWERPETIAQFAEQFGNFEEVGEASGGVMHAVFPDEHASLERNEVLEEATEIGGTTAPAGAWIQSWKFTDDELWSLVSDGILEGYSIGAMAVNWNGPMEQDELPDEVTVPDRIDEDALVWELTDGIIREVSAVDIPAVPDALILETKAEADKRLSDHLGNRDGFLEEALQRGHSEPEAERLWEYLNRAVDIEGAGEPGKQSVLARAGKAFLSALSGTDDDGTSKTSEDLGREKDAGDFEAEIFRVVAPEDKADNYEDEVLGIGVDFPNSDVYVDWRNEVFPDELDEPHVSIYGSTSDLEQATGNTTEQIDTLNAKAAKTLFDASLLPMALVGKEGRTLSHANRDSLFATIDASLDVLQDAGVEHGMTRFTDRDDVAFDLSEHKASEWADDSEEGEEEDEDEPDDEDDTGSDTPDDKNMSNNSPNGEEDKSLAEQNAEQIGELTAAIETLTEAVTGPEAKTAEIEIGGETYEVPETQVKAALGVDEGAGVSVADAIESLKSAVDQQGERLDRINQQSGVSTQLERSAETEEGDDSGLEGIGKALS